ncbi:MOP flippase family protein [Microbacterium testaceum]|uniref:MOP flippase family protein n=1 Tax=Microbacterium testaceum TaxID=2033 RepID=UPI0017851337|nr:MOP flippase family protein [Microbacterium testaceum]
MTAARATTATSWTAISVLSTSVAQLVMMLLLARILDIEQMGLVSTVLIFSSFLEVFVGLGLTAALIQRRRVTSRELASVHWANLSLALVGLIIVWAVSAPIASLFGAPSAAPLVVVSALAFVFTAAGQAHRAVLEKRLDFRPLGLADVAFAVVSLTSALLLALAGWGGMSAAAALVLASAARTAVFVLAGRRVARIRLHFRFSELRRFLRYGVWQSTDGVLNYVGNTLATIATGRFVSTAALGGFNLAFTLGVSLAGRVSPILTRVLFPYFAIIQDDRTRVREAYLKLLTLVGVLNIPALVCVSLTARDVMTVVYGEKWAAFGPVLGVLAIAGAIRSLGYPVGSLLAGTDKLRLGVYLNMGRTVVNVPLILLMTLFWGVDGAAWSLVVMAVVSYGLGYVCLNHVVATPVRAYLRATSTPILLAIPPAVAVMVVGWSAESLPTAVRLSAQVAAGIGAFVVSLVLCPDRTVGEMVQAVRRRGVRAPQLDVAVVLPADERFDGTGGAVASWVRNAYSVMPEGLEVGVFCPRGHMRFHGRVPRVRLRLFDLIDALVRIAARGAAALVRRNPDGIVRVATMGGRIWAWWLAPLVCRSRAVHLHNEPGYALALRRAGYRGRIVLHMHNDPIGAVGRIRGRRWPRGSTEELLSAVDAWVFCSEHLAAQARAHLGITATVVVPNGATVPDAVPLWHEVGNLLRIAFAGRLIPEKGALQAVQTVSELARRRAVVLDIYGGKAPGAAVGESAYTRALRALAAEVSAAHPGSAVNVHGFVPPDVMTEELAQADVFLYPCQWDEPFGMVLLDAMIVGTPVVTVARGGIPEIVRTEAGGVVLSPAASVAELAKAVETVAGDTRYLDRRRAAREVAAERFGWRAIAERLLPVIDPS